MTNILTYNRRPLKFNNGIFSIPFSTMLKTGLVAYWKLDETTGLISYDSYGTNDGSISDVSINRPGKINNAVLFRAEEAGINCGNSNSLKLTKTGSISAWIYANTIVDGNAIVSKNRWLNDTNGYSLGIYGTNGLWLETCNSGGGDVFTINTGITTGQWYHVVGTWSTIAGTMDLYINTNNSHRSTCSTAAVSDSYDLYIGRDAHIGDSGYEFKGLIDEVGIWNRVLTLSEVQQLYNFGHGLTYPFIQSSLLDNLISYWNLNEVSGNIKDSFGNYDGSAYDISQGSPGKIGYSLKMDGVNNHYANFGTTVGNNGLNDLSVSLWCKIDDSIGFQGILGKWDPVEENYWYLGINTNTMFAVFNGSVGYNINTSVDDISIGVWHHIVYIIDRDTSALIYKNGELIPGAPSISAYSSYPMSNTSRFAIGTLGANLSEWYLNGSVDEVGLWYRTLTPTEVSTLYNNGNGLTYPFV
jgi:hypothetical protein